MQKSEAMQDVRWGNWRKNEDKRNDKGESKRNGQRSKSKQTSKEEINEIQRRFLGYI